jgi:hypothetical protein
MATTRCRKVSRGMSTCWIPVEHEINVRMTYSVQEDNHHSTASTCTSTWHLDATQNKLSRTTRGTRRPFPNSLRQDQDSENESDVADIHLLLLSQSGWSSSAVADASNTVVWTSLAFSASLQFQPLNAVCYPTLKVCQFVG